MSLSEAATRVAQQKAGGVCTVGTLLGSLDQTDAALLNRWLAEKDTTGKYVKTAMWIGRVLAHDGHRMAGMTLARHRRGDCDCP